MIAPTSRIRGEVAGKRRHPLFEPGRLVRIERRQAGRIERVDQPRAFRLCPAAKRCPDQVRAVIPPAEADARDDQTGAVARSYLEEPPTRGAQAGTEPVARPRGQDRASARQLLQDRLAQGRDRVRSQAARIEVAHRARGQAQVQEAGGGCRGRLERSGVRRMAKGRCTHATSFDCGAHVVGFGSSVVRR